MASEISVVFGALAPAIKDQVPGLSERDADIFERDAQAITRCNIRGLISDSVAHTARKRLIKRIASAIGGKP